MSKINYKLNRETLNNVLIYLFSSWFQSYCFYLFFLWGWSERLTQVELHGKIRELIIILPCLSFYNDMGSKLSCRFQVMFCLPCKFLVGHFLLNIDIIIEVILESETETS